MKKNRIAFAGMSGVGGPPASFETRRDAALLRMRRGEGAKVFVIPGRALSAFTRVFDAHRRGAPE
jgi:hypothetical protein